MMGDQTCPQNVLHYISVHTVEKVQKIYEFRWHTSSSEPYSKILKLWTCWSEY